MTNIFQAREQMMQDGPAVRCDGCNLFTKRRDARIVPDDVGDYGVVYTWLVLCNREACPGA